MPVYALCDTALAFGLCDGVLVFEDEREAEEDFVHVVTERPPFTVAQRWLFRDRETAERANESTDDEVMVDESLAYRTLEYERGFGFNFVARNAAPGPLPWEIP